jgi:hypothetical protein
LSSKCGDAGARGQLGAISRRGRRGISPGCYCRFAAAPLSASSLSGLAGPCQLTVVRGLAHISWTAKATDKAGHVTTVRGSANLFDFYIAGVPEVHGFFQVKIGRSYLVKAFVVTTVAPRYVFPAPLGVPPHPVGPAMTEIGKDLWAIQITVTRQMRDHRFWALGVRAGGKLHLIQFQLPS